MQVVLVMFRSDGERRSFSVVRNMTVIGRREDCDLRIPVGDVSRKHCRLVRTDDGIRIEDLGSSNGTHVNGQRIRESDLNAGDTVGVGPVQFIVQIDGVPEDEEILPPTAQSAEPVNGHETLQPSHPAEDTGGSVIGEPMLEEVPQEDLVADEEPAESVAEADAIHDAEPVENSEPLTAEAQVESQQKTVDEDAPASEADAEVIAESEFGFVVDETDPEHSAVDFNIDLGTQHGQPHGNA